QAPGSQGQRHALEPGFGSWSNWWRPTARALLSAQVPAWLLERLKIWVDLLKIKILDEKICQAKVALARACSGPRPKGVGALSQMQLQKRGTRLVALYQPSQDRLLGRDGP